MASLLALAAGCGPNWSMEKHIYGHAFSAAGSDYYVPASEDNECAWTVRSRGIFFEFDGEGTGTFRIVRFDDVEYATSGFTGASCWPQCETWEYQQTFCTSLDYEVTSSEDGNSAVTFSLNLEANTYNLLEGTTTDAAITYSANYDFYGLDLSGTVDGETVFEFSNSNTLADSPDWSEYECSDAPFTEKEYLDHMPDFGTGVPCD